MRKKKEACNKNKVLMILRLGKNCFLFRFFIRHLIYLAFEASIGVWFLFVRVRLHQFYTCNSSLNITMLVDSL